MRGDTDPNLMDEPTVTEIAGRYGKNPAQILLRHLVQNGMIVLPKSVNERRIISNGQVSWCLHALSVCHTEEGMGMELKPYIEVPTTSRYKSKSKRYKCD